MDIVPPDHPADDHLDYFAFGYWTKTDGGTTSFGGVFYGGSPVFTVNSNQPVGARKASYTGRAVGHYKDNTVANGRFSGEMELTATFDADATFESRGR